MLNRITEKRKGNVVNAKTDDLISPKRPFKGSILETSQIVELICIFYKISDNPQNVCAPGTLHATSKRVNLNHVFFFIKKLKGMASVLEDNEFLSKLISGDVASNELYYHKSCYKTFLSRYQQQISKKLNSNKEMRKNKENLVKAMRLSQIVNQVYDQEQYESVSSFEVL